MKILFVCLGNICRSPMAEAYMRDLIRKHQVTSMVVDSCGTSGWHQGERPHHKTLEVLTKDGVSSSNLRSRPLMDSDFDTFDVIIGMDKNNVRDLKRLAPPQYHPKIHLFLDVLTGYEGCDVPDPWYTGDFEETRRFVRDGVSAWFTKLM